MKHLGTPQEHFQFTLCQDLNLEIDIYLFVFIVTVIEEFQHRRGEEREENEWQK